MKFVTCIVFICLAVIYTAALRAGEDIPNTIEQFAEMVRLKGRKGLEDEFSDIESNPIRKFRLEDYMLTPEAVEKNIYGESTICLNETRVKLSIENNDPTSDYIHANFVDGYKQTKAYIATQAPFQKTWNDFWRMVWEQKCLVIVKLANVINRKYKDGHWIPIYAREQYWGLEVNDIVTHGNYNIKTTNVEPKDDYIVSSLELTNSKTKETRKVSHCQLISWPDEGVPANVILDFLDVVHDQQRQMVKTSHDKWSGDSRGPPIIFHCGSGGGKTGASLTLDISRLRVKNDGTVDVKETLRKLRFQRTALVQTSRQYEFCNLALIKYAQSQGLLGSVDLSGFDNSPLEDETPESLTQNEESKTQNEELQTQNEKKN